MAESCQFTQYLKSLLECSEGSSIVVVVVVVAAVGAAVAGYNPQVVDFFDQLSRGLSRL
jgi:hypothetical protein